MAEVVDYSRLDPAFHSEYLKFFNDEYTTPRLSVLFLSEFRAKNFYAIERVMKKRPETLFSIGFSSMSCAGAYGMPVWQYICNDIKENKNKNDDEFRRSATLVARLAPERSRAHILFQFGFRGDWLDLVREALVLGIDDLFPLDEHYYLFSEDVIRLLCEHLAEKATNERRDAERKALEEAEQKECVVCMNADAVSQLPCGHVCMCKQCGTNNPNKTCPLCRTPY